ncbi:hypothetical protein J3R83DRAFT_13904 [Lanmaoa asiatica]|nr:hypothetical protein J3R83DRAFT_13904 [Lanmaoa asiatica]
MYTTVFEKAPIDPELGKLYRDEILLPGGSRDGMDLLKVCQMVPMHRHQARSILIGSCLGEGFVGHEPNPRAFINEIEQTGLVIYGTATLSPDLMRDVASSAHCNPNTTSLDYLLPMLWSITGLWWLPPASIELVLVVLESHPRRTAPNRVIRIA